MPTSFLHFGLSTQLTVSYIIKLSDKPFEETQKMKTEMKGNTFENVTITEDLTVICNGVFPMYWNTIISTVCSSHKWSAFFLSCYFFFVNKGVHAKLCFKEV